MKVRDTTLRKEVDADRKRARDLVGALQSLFQFIRKHHSRDPEPHQGSWFYTARIIEKAFKQIDDLWGLEEVFEKKEPKADGE